MPEGPGLSISCGYYFCFSKGGLEAWLSFQGAAFIAQGIMDSWVQRVTGKVSERLCFQDDLITVSNCPSNGIECVAEERYFFISEVNGQVMAIMDGPQTPISIRRGC